MLLETCNPRLVAPLVLLMTILAGCFQTGVPEPPPSVDKALADRVGTALAGHEDDALTYAGLYEVLADRFESKAYATTTEAATVAGRAADILSLPGVLRWIVDDELNPLLGTPQPITPELAARAAAKLRELSAACREVAR